jgi:hypothetical protein
MTALKHGPPIKKVGGRTPHHQGRPSTNTTSSYDTADIQDSNASSGQPVWVGLRRRRAGAQRLPLLDSGYADPWRYEPPRVNGYADAVAHLLAEGLTPAPNKEALQVMWRAGGASRRVAQVVAQRWELAS